jgi:hypothetical protein
MILEGKFNEEKKKFQYELKYFNLNKGQHQTENFS